jgi:hypothetical protein
VWRFYFGKTSIKPSKVLTICRVGIRAGRDDALKSRRIDSGWALLNHGAAEKRCVLEVS